ncbi:MAG: tyrosine--tRNA ligase, partial [Muribaculaceae bacterium]|nr:tyrosine--tRNA ligase [Muribaculaceae bacterium]
EKYLKIFTSLTKEEIEALATEHAADPGRRPMQKRLAKELTVMVHSEKDYEAAVEASAILFSNQAAEALRNLDERTLLDVFEGVPTFQISRSELEAGIPALDLLAVKSGVFPSKGEARKMVQAGAVSVNKEKLTDPAATIDATSLLGGKYIHIQKGKKNHFLLIAE